MALCGVSYEVTIRDDSLVRAHSHMGTVWLATDRLLAREVAVKSVTFANDAPLALIAGPCQLESLEHARMHDLGEVL